MGWHRLQTQRSATAPTAAGQEVNVPLVVELVAQRRHWDFLSETFDSSVAGRRTDEVVRHEVRLAAHAPQHATNATQDAICAPKAPIAH